MHTECIVLEMPITCVLVCEYVLHVKLVYAVHLC